MCDPNNACNLDENAFKGIFVRNLRYLVDTSHQMAQFHNETTTYTKFLERNVEAMVANASCVPESDNNSRLRFVLTVYFVSGLFINNIDMCI